MIRKAPLVKNVLSMSLFVLAAVAVDAQTTVAVRGNPLDDIDGLRDVRFVMKNGMVFTRHGVMTPGKFFHAGPVNGWRRRRIR